MIWCDLSVFFALSRRLFASRNFEFRSFQLVINRTPGHSLLYKQGSSDDGVGRILQKEQSGYLCDLKCIAPSGAVKSILRRPGYANFT